MNSGDFKYFIKVEKAFQENKDWYVQGIASGTMEDRDEEKMGLEVLKAFCNHLPLPLTDSHPREGQVLGEMGTVVEAKVMDDNAHSLFIKAKLDKDSPAAQYLMKQVQKGKKFAFSIEGYVKKAITSWSDKLKKMIKEYQEITPRAISITSEPSYLPSFLDVVSKSYSLVENETLSDNSKVNLNETNNMKKSKTETEQVVAKAEEVKTEEVKAEVVEQSVEEVKEPEIIAEEPKAEVKTEEVVAEVVEAEVVEDSKEVKDPVAETEPVKVEEVEAKPEVVEPKVEVSQEPVAPKTIAEAVKVFAKSKSDKKEVVRKEYEVSTVDVEEEAEEMKEAITEKVEEAIDEITEEKEEEDKMDMICSKLDQVISVLSQLVESDKMVHSEMGKSFKSNEVLFKSFHEDIEAIKSQPLLKKSRVVGKSFEDRKESPRTIADTVKDFIGE